jgi:hypothetical protein
MFRAAETMFRRAKTLFSGSATLFRGSASMFRETKSVFRRTKTMFAGMKTMFRTVADHVLVRRNLVTERLGRVLSGENLVPGDRTPCSRRALTMFRGSERWVVSGGSVVRCAKLLVARRWALAKRSGVTDAGLVRGRPSLTLRLGKPAFPLVPVRQTSLRLGKQLRLQRRTGRESFRLCRELTPRSR